MALKLCFTIQLYKKRINRNNNICSNCSIFKPQIKYNVIYDGINFQYDKSPHFVELMQCFQIFFIKKVVLIRTMKLILLIKKLHFKGLDLRKMYRRHLASRIKTHDKKVSWFLLWYPNHECTMKDNALCNCLGYCIISMFSLMQHFHFGYQSPSIQVFDGIGSTHMKVSRMGIYAT